MDKPEHISSAKWQMQLRKYEKGLITKKQLAGEDAKRINVLFPNGYMLNGVKCYTLRDASKAVGISTRGFYARYIAFLKGDIPARDLSRPLLKQHQHTPTDIYYNGKHYIKASDLAKDLDLSESGFYNRLAKYNQGLISKDELTMKRMRKPRK